MKKINLGCGWDGPEGWINIDRSWKYYLSRYSWSRHLLRKALRFFSILGLVSKSSVTDTPLVHGFKRYDISKGLPFSNEEVDYIYTSHMLEHLTSEKADFVLKECHRVLKKGGIVRILVPDLGLFIDNYLKSKQTGNPESADRFIESIWLCNTGKPLPLINRILRYNDPGHKWAYDFESLAYRIRKTGLKEVKKCVSGKGDMVDIQLFSGEVEHTDSLYLEAEK